MGEVEGMHVCVCWGGGKRLGEAEGCFGLGSWLDMPGSGLCWGLRQKGKYHPKRGDELSLWHVFLPFIASMVIISHYQQLPSIPHVWGWDGGEEEKGREG